MNFAIAFSAYDNEREDILDPSYGNLQFTTYEWGEDENGEPFLKYVTIPSHSCTPAELGLEDRESARFYPLKPEKQNTVELY